MNLAAAYRRRSRLRYAVVGLIAGAATAASGLPAHADVPGRGAPAPATARPAPASAVVASRSSSPRPAHRHHGVVKRAPVAVSTKSKRDGGQSAVPAPAAGGLPATGCAARWTAATARIGSTRRALAARAPPARQ